MSIRSDAVGVDRVPLLTHIFNHIFVSSEVPVKWKTSVVLPIPKVTSPAKFSDGSANGETFRRQHSTTVAVLKVTEDIRLNMEDGQVTVLLLLDFSEAFDMVVHGLLLRNAQNYSVDAGMLVGHISVNEQSL
jgi:hypothetical protein